MLKVEHLDFSYGERKILDDISFEADGNSVISILGPNGVGKTTLLKCLCNLHKPQKGSMTVDDKDILTLPGRELAKYIGYVPQSTEPSRSTVFDTALIGRRPYIEWGMSKKDIEITWSALRSLGLEDLSMRYVDEISGGEYQKVQIARAMVQEPKVLILDEPTNNLDVANQHVTMHTVLDAVNSRGMCTIMTMHDINLAVHYSDKLMFIKNGKIFSYGGLETVTPDTIKDVYGIKADVIEYKGKPFVIPDTFPEILAHTHSH